MLNSQSFASLTGRLADRLNGRANNNHAVRILTLVERLERQAGALDKVRAARNPMDTDAAHRRKVAKAAKRLQAESMKTDEIINDISVLGFKEIAELMESQTGLTEDEYSAEIRAAFRGMTEKQRSDTLVVALKEGDSRTIAAVGLPPAVLSGVLVGDQERYLDAIRQMKAPELILESEDLSEALQTATAARQLAGLMFDESYNPTEQTTIDKAERDTAEAEKALEESILERP